MSYAQINYNQELGNGRYTIGQAGCFLIAFCNLLNGFGSDVDPVTLNDFFRSHGFYIRDADGANEDLAWSTVSLYNPQVHVTGTGSGWPDTSDSIVKFYYKAKNGVMTTHFCKVYSADHRMIVDSYDGQVKESPYGDPVAYATYSEPQPHIIQPYTPPAADDSAFHPWFGKVTATNVVNVRSEPNKDSRGSMGNVNADGMLHPGNVFDVVGYIHAQAPYGDGRDVWLKTVPGHYVWAYATNFFSLPGHGAGVPVAPAEFVKKGYGTQAYGEGEIPSDNEGKVDVRVIPPDPNKWMRSYVQYKGTDGLPEPQIFTAIDFGGENNEPTIVDLSGSAISGKLKSHAQVEVAGEFEKDGVQYYRTTASEDNGTWYGIRKDYLEAENDIDRISKEVLALSRKQKAIAKVGLVAGLLKRLRGKK